MVRVVLTLRPVPLAQSLCVGTVRGTVFSGDVWERGGRCDVTGQCCVFYEDAAQENYLALWAVPGVDACGLFCLDRGG